ncbi:MAG TPA: ABC-F family ATP-binding cassette domain-containing protein [Kiloniellaceae bacterium]|nr:ABC-F family ATP-binding cassette domain-containing protein [Kiloniellaceae bacterium]
MLTISNLTYRIAGEPLLEAASVTLYKGERVGLVGRNGSGKSTLLKLITHDIEADEGTIELERSIRIGKVAQEAPGGQDSLIDFVLAADKERSTLLAAAETARDPLRLAEIHERLRTIEADSAPARAARILAGLGFDEAAQQRPCAVFSGGWRMRVALAALLFSQPDLMLLDEPTNHLDLEAALWLEGFLKSYQGSYLLVSHDRGLLDRAVERIVHLADRKLTAYAGNYSRFEKTRQEQLRLQAALFAKQQAQRQHMQSFIDRFRYKASKARQAQSRLKALERMEPVANVIDSSSVTFRFPEGPELAPPILTLEGASAGYGDGPPVLRDLNLRLDMDDRIALLGANGNGKTTLARLLAGRLQPRDGRIVRAGKLKVGYFAQDQADELDLAATPLDHMARALPNALPEKRRAQLGRFGFGQDRADLAVGKLSGGEKARLIFALVSRHEPQLLLLDEPTNHLDIESRQALVEALLEFRGAVVLVSHDPHLVELVADRFWLVADGAVRPFDGDLEEYRDHLLAQRRAERSRSRKERTGDESNEKSALNKKDKRRAAAARRAETAALKAAVRKAEKEIARLTGEKQALEARLGDAAVYDDTKKAQNLQMAHGKLAAALAVAEETWLEATAALEDAETSLVESPA